MRKRLVVQPPAHWLLAAYLKYKPPAASAAARASAQRGYTIAELKARFPHGVMKPGM